MYKHHPFVLLFYRIFLPNSKLGKEAFLVAQYNETTDEKREAALRELAIFLRNTRSFQQVAEGHWTSRTGMVEVLRDSAGHEISIFGGSVIDAVRLTPKQALQFTATVIESLPGDRRARKRPF